jgi:hypothetical protein
MPSNTLSLDGIEAHNLTGRQRCQTKQIFCSVTKSRGRPRVEAGFNYRQSNIFSSPQYPDRPWGPPCLLSNGNPADISPEVQRWGLKLITHPISCIRTRGSIPPLADHSGCAV